MKKKILALVLVIALVASLAVALVACNPDNPTGNEYGPADADIKFGLICLHDENSTYDKNFIDAAKQIADDMQVRLIMKTGIPEDSSCYEAAVDLVDQGCDVIFADSFGHEDHIIRAAKEFPDVQFCHATGIKAHTENIPNYHNAFSSIYEGRYIAGIVAGYELKEMIESGKITPDKAKIGYVGAYPYAEVVSGYTSFFLGARSVCPSATMEVQYTGSWYDETAEKETAQSLIKRGCVVISQHADSMGAPTACEEAGVPNVTYNISTKSTCANTYLVGSKVNWVPYFKYMIECVRAEKAIKADWIGSYSDGSVEVLEFGNGVSEEAKAAVAAAEAAFIEGTLKVFDCSKFTVKGEHITSYMADVNYDEAFKKDTEVILTENGITYFAESYFRAGPYFDVRIDGITEINK